MAFETLTIDTQIYPMLPVMLEMIEAVYAEGPELMISVAGDEPFAMLHHADAAALAESMHKVFDCPLVKNLQYGGVVVCVHPEHCKQGRCLGMTPHFKVALEKKLYKTNQGFDWLA